MTGPDATERPPLWDWESAPAGAHSSRYGNKLIVASGARTQSRPRSARFVLKSLRLSLIVCRDCYRAIHPLD